MARRSKIDLAVSSSQAIEQALVKRFGATGRGLHDKISSVQDKFPKKLIKRMRRVATLRNVTVHEDANAIKDPRAFERDVEDILSEVRRIGGGPGPGLGMLGWIMVAMIAGGLATWVISKVFG